MCVAKLLRRRFGRRLRPVVQPELKGHKKVKRESRALKKARRAKHRRDLARCPEAVGV